MNIISSYSKVMANVAFIFIFAADGGKMMPSNSIPGHTNQAVTVMLMLWLV